MLQPRIIAILTWVILGLLIAMFLFNKKISFSTKPQSFGFENPFKKTDSQQTGN